LSTEKKIVWGEVKGEILAAFQQFVRTHKEATGAFVANESVKGLNLIDALIRKHDVVVANPPFSGRRNWNPALRDDLKTLYPEAANDLYSCFISRCIDLTSPKGYTGMINIHSFMFTSSFENLREQIIDTTAIETMVHLGPTFMELSNPYAQQCTMYVLNNENPSVGTKGIYFRMIKYINEEKERMLENSLQDYLANGDAFSDPHVFILEQEKLKAIPSWPVVYWVSEKIRGLFKHNLLSDLANCVQGLATTANFRFLRLWWEPGYGYINFSMKHRSGTINQPRKWYPYMKGGDVRRWYGNQEFIVNYSNDGTEIKTYVMDKYRQTSYAKNFTDERWDKLIEIWVVKNQDYYFHEGLTYSFLTISNLSVRYLPPGFIFDVAGSSIFPKNFNLCLLLGILNSKLSTFLIKLISPTVNYQVGDLARIPIPDATEKSDLIETVKKKVRECIRLKKQEVKTQATSWEFTAPSIWNYGIYDLLHIEKELAILETDISEAVYRLYEIEQADIDQIEAEFDALPGKHPRIDDLSDSRLRVIENFYLEKHVPDEVVRKTEQIIEEDDADESESDEETPHGRGRQRRFLTFEELCLASGFHPETVYAYITANKLERPEERYELAVAWVSYAVGIILGRFKPGEKGALGSGITEDGQVLLKADFAKLRTLADSDGIMVLDPGHPEDLTARIEEVLAVLLGEEAGKKIIHVLGGDLRRFLEKEFFAKWHIPQYRKRPVYWLLQTVRKNYGLYLFHERLTADSLFLIQEKYLQPKIALEQNRLAELRGRLTATAEGREKRALEKEIEKGENLIDELNEFLNKVKAVLERGYDPDIDDGVILNMAPLHELIPWAEPKKYWEELQKGKYDWAHLAMKYWPDRVREKCRKDKSLAIAHGLA